MSHQYLALYALGATLILTACAEEKTATEEVPPAIEEVVAETPAVKDININAVDLLTIESRPAADAENDAARKPAAVIDFMDISAGDVILELEAGDGYYTELFSYATGSNGRVYMQNPAAFDAFLGDTVTTRLADNRLANVEYIRSNFDALPVAADSVDIVTWFLGPHELYYFPDGTEEGFGDPAKTYAQIATSLKPDGRFIVLDHATAAGSPESTGGETHRIDPAIIIALAEEAGLVVDKTSDILANAEDDYSKNVFDPSVRRKTDRFLISFKKAE